MGGWGSGPQRRGGKKRTAESCSSIDTAEFRKSGWLVSGYRSGTITFGKSERDAGSSLDCSLDIAAGAGSLRLVYRQVQTGERFDYRVPLVSTVCHFGGVRCWFLCPLSRNGVFCGRRVRKLFLTTRYFGCRHCHSLTYSSTQTSDRRVYAALRQGLDFDGFGDPSKMSLGQLGFSLKVLTAQKQRLDRIGGGRAARRAATVG